MKVDVGGYGISWNDDLDLETETIWENGILIETEKTGIYQADISKIERGKGNPSIATLERLAKG